MAVKWEDQWVLSGLNGGATGYGGRGCCAEDAGDVNFECSRGTCTEKRTMEG